MDTSDDVFFNPPKFEAPKPPAKLMPVTDDDMVGGGKKRKRKLEASINTSEWSPPILGMGGVLGLEGKEG
jgi:hypothetical protein